MLSFRPKIGVWLALTALALQLALSFGHAHLFQANSYHSNAAVTGTIAKFGKIPAQEPADSNGEYSGVCAFIQFADGSLAQALFQLPHSFVDRTTGYAGYVAVLISTCRAE